MNPSLQVSSVNLRVRLRLVFESLRLLFCLPSPRTTCSLSGLLHVLPISELLRAIAPLLQTDACGTPEAAENVEIRRLLRELLLMRLPASARRLVPSLERREAPVQNTWVYQNEVMKWDLEPDARVLDVGSGGFPFSHATHLADKYPDGTSHRFEAIVRDQRPFFEVDVERLPFANNSYDFVFCSHLLEHLDNPGAAMRELMRVGRRGYIEVPTRLSDVMFNFTRLDNHHRWHGLVLGTTVVLIEWNGWERRELGNDFFDALHSEYSNGFQDFFERNRDLFFASCHWEGSFDFVVINKHGRVIDASAPQAVG